jgi:hypothetical protein
MQLHFTKDTNVMNITHIYIVFKFYVSLDEIYYILMCSNMEIHKYRINISFKQVV